MKLLVYAGIFLLVALGRVAPALAYSQFSHDRMTRIALKYLRTNPHVFVETDRWLDTSRADPEELDGVLARAVVDTDSRPDMWVDAIFHPVFTGATDGKYTSTFTTLLHYINVRRPGILWDHDGYSYDRSTREGVDGYLGKFSVKIRGDLSAPLGGISSRHVPHGAALGPYWLGFKESRQYWDEHYPHSISADKIVLPPASVPAELAFWAMMGSERAQSHLTDVWSDHWKIISGLLSNKTVHHQYWRGEIPGLPRYFDALGIVLHMAQDMTVPQHTMGTIELCHPDTETAADLLVNHLRKFDDASYTDGSFHGDAYPDANGLYDEALVRHLRDTLPFLDPRRPLTITARLVELAKHTTRWDFFKPDSKHIQTRLPDGRQWVARNCNLLFTVPEVTRQLMYQFNLGVAATATFFEIAAAAYENQPRFETRDLMRDISRTFE